MPNKVTTAELSTDVVGDVNTKWLTVVGVMAAEAMTMIAATAAAAAAVAAWWYLLGRVQIDATILQHLSIVTITVIARITVHVSVTACVCYDRQAVITCYKHVISYIFAMCAQLLVYTHWLTDSLTKKALQKHLCRTCFSTPKFFVQTVPRQWMWVNFCRRSTINWW